MKHRRGRGVVIDTLAAAQYFSSTTTASATTSNGKSVASTYHRHHPTGLDAPVTPQYRPPRAPIVLCHGLYGFDRRGPASFPKLQIRYWGGIEEALAKLGAKVVGGLDCRLLLSHIRNRAYHVQSLTTISTPHRGSPVMDWFRDHVGVGVTYCQSSPQAHGRQPRFFDSILRMVDTPAYANLTTDYCRNHFNPNTPDDPTVAYYSYGADGTMIPPWTFLGRTWQVVHAKEGTNDGIVSVESARWGRYIKTLDASHWELNGER
ncbi:hypothetical protein BX666DRAFT_1867025 [Dichotomocladium elegans]|nr:hypothetical protein BX666DRAFT_1867025 [Dichotomocladium elegans]